MTGMLHSMAVMASRAYEDTWADERQYEYHEFFENSKTGAACHVAQMGGVLYIIPRGLEPDDYRDWISVLRAGGRDFSGLPGRVHKGMAIAWESIEPKVIRSTVDRLIDCPTLEIRLCGHSMGGALCRFAHWKLRNLSDKIRSWTFGAPGQFSKQGASRWNSVCESTSVHLVNGMDFVPWIARIAGWHQGGSMIYLDKEHKANKGWTRAKLWWYRVQLMMGRGPLTGGLFDHQIKEYIHALQQLPAELTGKTPGVVVK